MRPSWWIEALVLAAGCGDDGESSLPACEPRATFGVDVSARGDRLTASRGAELAMVVITSSAGEMALEEQLDCDPQDEGSLELISDAWDEGAWQPPPRSEVRVRSWTHLAGNYAELRGPEGDLIWEGGTIDAESSGRFRLEGPEGLPACGDECFATTYLRVAVRGDEGDILLVSGERRVVTVDGEPFVAAVAWAKEEVFLSGCGIIVEDFGGAGAEVYLARTTPVDLTLAGPGAPADDECPAERPTEWTSCTTRADLDCHYEDPVGCGFDFECRGCFWRQTGSSFPPGGVDCGHDPWSCQGKGCPEESSCTECPCAGWTTERWRCVWPGDECPPCE